MNAWEELRAALQKPERPDGAKTITEIADETGASRSAVERKMRALIAKGTWQSVNAGPNGCAVFWPVEQRGKSKS